MIKILKLSDKTYAKSLAKFHASYEQGFPQREQFLCQALKDRGVQFEFFHHGDLRDWDTIFRERLNLEHLLMEEAINFLMVDNPFSALIIPKSYKGEVIFDCIDHYEEMYITEFGLDDPGIHLMRLGLCTLFSRATKIIAQSPFMLDWVREHHPKTPDVIDIPNGYDGKLFQPLGIEEREQVRRRVVKTHFPDWDGNGPLILFAGKLGKWYKGIFSVVGSLKSEWRLLIVGDGPLRDQLTKGNSSVVCTGRVDLSEVPQFMNASDVCVLPVNDDSPLATSEYMACSKPVVHLGSRIQWLLQDPNLSVESNGVQWHEAIEYAYYHRKDIGIKNWERVQQYEWSKASERFLKFVTQSTVYSPEGGWVGASR